METKYMQQITIVVQIYNLQQEQLMEKQEESHMKDKQLYGAVILNRVKSSQFPNTIAGVIYEKGAFTAVADGQINVPIKEGSTVLKAAQDAMNGWDPTNRMYLLF